MQRLNGARLGVAALALLVTAGAWTIAATPALAVGTDRYVSATNGNDTGANGPNDCTDVRHPCRHVGYAVDQSDSNDIVHVAAGTYAESEIEIAKNLTIEGASSGITTISATGEGIFGVFGSDTGDETTTPTVTFKNLNISGNSGGEGILATIAAVNIVNSHVDRNQAGGVIAADAVVAATNSTFNGNGQGAQNNPLTGSGMLVVTGAATVDHSTFDGNGGSGITLFPFDILPGGPAIRPNAASGAPVSVALDHSTVSNNASGGVAGLFSSIQVTSSTLAGNTGAGVDNAGGIAQVENSTITGTKPFPPTVNGAPVAVNGAGLVSEAEEVPILRVSSQDVKAAASKIQKELPKSAATSSPKIAKRLAAAAAQPADLSQGQIAVTGSIVAAQAGATDCQLVDTNSIVDQGYNDSDDAANTCGFAVAKHDLIKTNPKLGPLAANGGPTKTERPLKGSPAIDVIPSGSANCDKAATDQRDLPRVQPVAGKCDMGAVELAATPLALDPNSLPHGTVGDAYSTKVTATGGQYPVYVFSLVDGSLPDGLTLSSTGTITGTPTKAGTFHFTVSVNDPVTRAYTIVIDAAAAPNDNGTAPISATGAPVVSMSVIGGATLLVGFALMVGAGLIGRRPGRHRVEH